MISVDPETSVLDFNGLVISGEGRTWSPMSQVKSRKSIKTIPGVRQMSGRQVRQRWEHQGTKGRISNVEQGISKVEVLLEEVGINSVSPCLRGYPAAGDEEDETRTRIEAG